MHTKEEHVLRLMRLQLFCIAWTAFLGGCERSLPPESRVRDGAPLQEHGSNSPTPTLVATQRNASACELQQQPNTTTASTNVKLMEKRLRELITVKTATGEWTEENLTEFLALVPQLQATGLFWDWVGVIRPSQLGRFREPILSSLRALTPTAGQPVDSGFRNAYRIAGYLRDSEVAQIALEQLPLVPPYHFPKTPPPKDWPGGTAEGLERLFHGDQGIVASAVVEYGDEQTLTGYREMLKAAPPDLQRLLIWGLGRSSELADFDLLMSLRAKVTDPAEADTLIRALNRIPVSMETVAKYPEVTSAERRPEDSKALLQTAAQCKARLAAQNLVVPLTLYDYL